MQNEQEQSLGHDALDDLVRQIGLEPGPEQQCAYLPDRLARFMAFRAGRLSFGIYHSLMDQNFRRSGEVFYRPVCRGCRQCMAVRIPTDTFQPSRTQRRCWSRNQDLDVQIDKPKPTAEKHALYVRYLQVRHDGQMSGDWDSFCDFLYDSPIETLEVICRLEGVLVGAGILDVEPEAVSIVYSYFEPNLASRSIGTFNILWTIDYCRLRGIPFVYLGYYVRDCRQMRYKIDYQPCELLHEDGQWRPAPSHSRLSSMSE